MQVPVLECDADLGPDDLFGGSQIKEDFDRALQVHDDFIAYALTNEGENPADIKRIPVNKKFGQTMRDDDAIQVA
ncbi:hypothetical protein [Mycolicibacter minnesotensis]